MNRPIYESQLVSKQRSRKALYQVLESMSKHGLAYCLGIVTASTRHISTLQVLWRAEKSTMKSAGNFKVIINNFHGHAAMDILDTRSSNYWAADHLFMHPVFRRGGAIFRQAEAVKLSKI